MSAETILNIRLQLALIGTPILYAVGNFGNLFTVLVLGRTIKQHPNSCALYLLCSSIINWVVINTVLIEIYYGVNHDEPTNRSNLLCKLRWAGANALFLASRSLMIAGCVDRWALCSQNTKLRSICRPEVARRVIAVIIIVATLLSIPVLIFFDNSSGLCAIDAAYRLTYVIYALILIGILPTILMIVFTLLARHNLVKIRSRVHPTGRTSQNIHIHKRDHHLMKMLVGEVLVFCITTCPYPVYTLYNYVTLPIKAYKSPLRLAVESLVGYIILPLLSYAYCCTQFYVYAYFSTKFREDFLALFRRGTQVRTTTKTTSHTIGYAPKTAIH